MPLPAPALSRSPVHTRRIACEGFEREDGLYDIDGWLIDTKGFVFDTPFRGKLPIGEPQHSLGLRITIDPTFTIIDVIAIMDATPTKACGTAAPNFAKLIGLKFMPGFNRAARQVLDGTMGCTHLLDLLGPMATTATQTVWAKRWNEVAPKESDTPPPIVNSCRGWADDGEMTAFAYPKFYKNPTTPREP